MTTLRGLRSGDWTDHCHSKIQEFFYNPSEPVLCIYYVNSTLMAELSFPTIPVYELAYFVREPNEVLRSENFREDILFGTVNDKVEGQILNVTQNILTPIFFKIETWPDSILFIR
ncbi:hypothetical protein KM043_006816 [Ampulex compressa]|nr:hypothetical protein KM043_006816 [Ampulex compressa]